MFGSTPLATIRGIPIRTHFTLYAAFALLVLQFGLWGIPAGILLFGSVLAHELGHAFVAQRFGIPIAAIDLHLLGGAALMAETPRRPSEEVWIAAAGPAVSFAIGLAAFVLATFFGATLSVTAPSLIAYLAAVNIGMGIFNLVPALPMDGGRIFRALLSAKMGALRATQLAAKVARVFAVLFVGAGLWQGAWSLALIGVFVYVLAGREEQMAILRARAAAMAVPRTLPWTWHEELRSPRF